MYDPSTEFTELNVPDDPAKDSKTRAIARFRKLVDPLTNPTATASGSTTARLDAQVSEKLRRENEAERKAKVDPVEAIEAADPHGLIPEDHRRGLFENRGFDPDRL